MKIDSYKFDTFLSAFLLAPSYRVYRHLLLISALTIISIYIVINHPAATDSVYNVVIVMICYEILIISAAYINMYWLIPHYLLKEKLFRYWIYLAVLVFSYLLLIAVVQIIIFEFHKTFVTKQWILVFINLMSSFINLGLMIVSVTTLVLLKHWNLSTQHIAQLQESGLQLELSILKKQINPHFLFNVINNANVLLKDKKGGASSILFKLEDLLRYQINESAREEIRLSSDISFLHDYLNLEKVRRDQFNFNISTSGDTQNVFLPPLLFIPFIENAVKFSQDSDHPSFVHISFVVKAKELYFQCENTIPKDGIGQRNSGGLGLKNIRRRLELLYPGKHQLQTTQQETKYIVDLQVSIDNAQLTI